MRCPAVVGGSALGAAVGWNVSNTGAVAQQLSAAYGVGLAVVGLFATAILLTHLAMQVPGGKASDRFGPRRTGLAGLALLAAANALALAAADPGLAIACRALAGVGTGAAFVSGSAYISSQGGSPFAQGMFGGITMGGAGLALALVPQAEAAAGWRAPWLTALGTALAALALLAAAPRDVLVRLRVPGERPSGIFRDSRLYRLAALYGASLGLSLVVGNWVVTLLDRHGGVTAGAAGAIGALTLLLGVVTRPLGGWLMRRRPDLTRAAVGASLAGGALGTLALVAAQPPALAVVGAALVGVAAGISFAPAFTGAARMRPDAPAASVGFVNGAGSLVAVAGTPLLGLAFSLPGGGRAGFAVVAALWALALVALPSEHELGVAATGAPGSRSG